MSGENEEMSDESAVSEASEITDIEEEDETTSEAVLCNRSLTTTYNSASVVILQLHLPTGFLHVIKY